MHAEEWKALRLAQAAASMMKLKGAAKPGTSVDNSESVLDDTMEGENSELDSTQIPFSESLAFNEQMMEGVSESELSTCVSSARSFTETGTHFLGNLLPRTETSTSSDNMSANQSVINYSHMNSYLESSENTFVQSSPHNLTITTSPLIPSLLPSKQ